MADQYSSVTDEIETTEQDFNRIKSAPDAQKLKFTYRRKEQGTNSLMTPESWGSNSIGYSVTKHVSPKSGKAYYYKSPLSGVKGVGILQPPKVYEKDEWKDPSHPGWKDPNWLIQQKLDGERIAINIGSGSATFYVRHRASSDLSFGKIANKDSILNNVFKFPPSLAGTILDAEVSYDVNDAWKRFVGGKSGYRDDEAVTNPLNAITKVLQSDPERASAYIKAYGEPYAGVFDAYAYKGQDITELPYKERLHFAEQAVKEINDSKVFVIPSVPNDQKWQYFQKLLAEGHEGIVIKDLNAKYGGDSSNTGMVKVKSSSPDIDVFIVGFVEGQGKFSGTVGGLTMATNLRSSSGEIRTVECQSVNAGTEAQREWFNQHRKEVIGLCYTIIGQRYSSGRGALLQHGRPRDGLAHPRLDKSPSDCFVDEASVPKDIWANAWNLPTVSLPSASAVDTSTIPPDTGLQQQRAAVNAPGQRTTVGTQRVDSPAPQPAMVKSVPISPAPMNPSSGIKLDADGLPSSNQTIQYRGRPFKVSYSANPANINGRVLTNPDKNTATWVGADNLRKFGKF